MNWTLVYIIATVLILPSLIYGSISQNLVYSTFETYAKKLSKSGITSAMLANKLLAYSNIDDVDVVQINGKLTDCYDSKHKVVKLSTSTYSSSSIASLGVCAHEIGHAVQDHSHSFMFRLRQFLVPVLNFVSKAYIPLIFVGSILSFIFYVPVVGYYIVWASVVMFGASLIFYIVTLPLEFDASKKALKLLKETDTMDNEELKCAKKVLNAAAQTYISAFMTSLLYFLRFLSYALIFAKRND
jgi:hypothetical protein